MYSPYLNIKTPTHFLAYFQSYFINTRVNESWEIKCRFKSCWCRKSILLFFSVNLKWVWPYMTIFLMHNVIFCFPHSFCVDWQPLDPLRRFDFLFEYELKGLLHRNFMPHGLSDILFSTFSSKCLIVSSPTPDSLNASFHSSLCHHPLFFNSLLNDLSRCSYVCGPITERRVRSLLFCTCWCTFCT